MNIKIIKSRRKSISLQIKDVDDVVVRAPYRMSQKEIKEFIDKHQDWLKKNLEKLSKERAEEEVITPLSETEVRALADRACKIIPERVEYFASKIGVTYGRISIRNQKTRWGSCSSKGNLNFNVGLMLVPPEVMDYVVVHELCHRLEMNHSKKFWEEVERVLPDYKVQEKWLKENGNKIIKKIRFT